MNRYKMKKCSKKQFAIHLIFLIFFLFGLNYSFAEQIIDTEDPLIVSKNTAFTRLKNGFFSDALSAAENALKMAQDRYGPTHPAIVPFLIDLGTIQRYMALFAEAQSSVEWALAIQEKALGPDHPQVGLIQGQLSSLLTDWGKWNDAAYFGSKALTILLNHPSTSSEDLTQVLNNLGTIEIERGNSEKAEKFLNQALKLQEQNPNSQPANMIQTLNLLSRTYLLNKDDSDAKTCLQRVLDISKNKFSDNSIEVADAMENMGNFYLSQNQSEKANALLEGALPIYQRFVGVYFGYSSLEFVRKLAKAFESNGKYKEAEDLLEKSQPTLKQVFGPRHPRVALGLLDLAQVENALGQKSLSQSELKEALEIAKSNFGDTHPLVIKIQNQILP